MTRRRTTSPLLSLPMRIRALVLHAADPQALAPFYRDTLGLDVCEASAGDVVVQAGATRVTFRPAEPGSAPYYHVAFNIPENKIERAIEWAAPRFPLIHVPGVGEPLVHFEAINAHSVYFWDPAGNLVELIARHDLNNAREGPFDFQDIRSCSEIGLVVDDVQRTVERLDETFGVGVYPAGRTPSDTFSMVGDATGTFILVLRDRTWLMTDDLPGRVFPTEVTLAGTGGAELRFPGFPYVIRSES